MNHFGLSATWIFITWMEPCWTTATRHQPNDWESIKVQFLSRHSQRIMDLSVAVQMLQRWHLRAAFFFSNRVTLRQMVGCHTWQNHIGSYSIFNLLSLTIDFESWFREKNKKSGLPGVSPHQRGLTTSKKNDLDSGPNPETTWKKRPSSNRRFGRWKWSSPSKWWKQPIHPRRHLGIARWF